MDGGSVSFQVGLGSEEDARALAEAVAESGGNAERRDAPGFLPVPVLLAIVIPPGVGLLATVVNKIVHSWRDRGVLIDARGTGDPRILKDEDIPAGTVIVLTRDGDKSQRTDVPEEKLSDYIAAALGALSRGDSASEADAKASAAG